MNRALVVNCSKPHYNLGVAKLTNYLRRTGWQVDVSEGDPGIFTPNVDLVALSVIFSWHAPIAREIALRMKDRAEIWCGGPGMTALAKWWSRETGGLDCQIGIDGRFEREPGEYRMAFASRGCPVGCWFCIVPKLEGSDFTLYWDFTPAPILCDNNLSALPMNFQEHIVETYRRANCPLLDANSGFEPRTFTAETRDLWAPLLRGPWRFAYDEMAETEMVYETCEILRDVKPKRKRIYVLLGNEPIENCLERAQRVIEWGAEPFCQPVISLNSLDGRPRVRFNWSEGELRRMARYFNRYGWRTVPDWREYRSHAPRPTSGEQPLVSWGQRHDQRRTGAGALREQVDRDMEGDVLAAPGPAVDDELNLHKDDKRRQVCHTQHVARRPRRNSAR